MREIIIEILYWTAIIIAVFEMYSDYKKNKMLVDLIIKKYPYRTAIILTIILRSIIIMY